MTVLWWSVDRYPLIDYGFLGFLLGLLVLAGAFVSIGRVPEDESAGSDP